MLQQIVVGVFLGLACSTIGVFFALRQKRGEAAFDRQLRWCETALSTFHEAGSAVVAVRNPDDADAATRAACWTEVINCYERLIPICGQRALYASAAGERAISQFMDSLWKLIDAHLRSHEGGSAEELCDLCLDRLADAWLTMSAEARGHLGLDPLRATAREDPGFTGSFKGRALHGHGVA